LKRFVAALLTALLPVTPAFAATSTSLVAEWIAPTTNVDSTPLVDLASYRVYVAASSVNGDPCPLLSFVSVAAPNSAPGPNESVATTITGLTPSTSYKMQVSAVDTSGNESGCSTVAQGTTLAVQPPLPLSNLSLQFTEEPLMALSVPDFEQIGDGGETEVDSATGAGMIAEAGDLIAVFTRYYDEPTASATLTVSDDINGAHTQSLNNVVSGTSNTTRIAAHYFQNSAADSDLDVTINPGGASAFIEASATIIRGAQTTGGPAGTQTSSTGTTTRTVTISGLASGDYIIVGMAHSWNTGPVTPGGSQTSTFTRNLAGYSTDIGYRIYSGVTSVSLEWTYGSNPGTNVGFVAYAFKVADAASASVHRLLLLGMGM
jgi:hypothetical protein